MSDTLRAAASAAVREVLTGPVREGTVVGTFPSALYVAVEGVEALRGSVLSVVRRPGIQLPNAVLLATDPGELTRVGPDNAVTVGQGGMCVGATRVTITRWWDPRPHPPAIDPLRLAGRVAELSSAAPAAGTTSAVRLAAATGHLTRAGQNRDVAAGAAAAHELVGAGPGLTPSGDDVLAGMLAAARVFAVAVSETGARQALIGYVDALSSAVLGLARHRTPAVSAALLAHATHAEVAAPAARLLWALAGRGSVSGAAAELSGVGHTSGVDLIAGIRAGAAAVIAAARTGRRTP